MPKESANRFQTGAGPDHCGGQRMPKNMRSGRTFFDARAVARLCSDAGDLCRGSQRSEWRLQAQEHAVFLNDWASLLDVSQQRVAGVLREWKLRRPSTLAIHAQQRIGPVYVGKLELADIPSAKAEAS